MPRMGIFVAVMIAALVASSPSRRVDSDMAARESLDEIDVVIREFAFDPDTLTVTVNTIVRWTNREMVLHSTTADDGAWESPLIEPGKSYSRRFGQPGIYPYYCTPHPFMRGVVIVESE